MKRVVLFFSFLGLFTTSAFSQIITYSDNFTSSNISTGLPPGWSVRPSDTSGYTERETNVYADAPASLRINIPFSLGDTIEVVTRTYNFTGYNYVFLTFSHICKVSNLDVCQIYCNEDKGPLNENWQRVDIEHYNGPSGTFNGARFSENSFSEWQAGNSAAFPTNSWWKTASFNVGSLAGGRYVQFKFVIITNKNDYTTSSLAGWFIDNIELKGSVNELKEPTLDVDQNCSDTVYNTGPFKLTAKAFANTRVPIKTPVVRYSATYNGITTQDSILMTDHDNDSIWEATIPQHRFGTDICYTVVAYDTVGNEKSERCCFHIKRVEGGGGAGDVVIGTGTTTDYYTPMNLFYQNSWTRQVYLASEFTPNGSGGMISKLAWDYNYTQSFSVNNQRCYFKAVDASTVVTGYVDPIADGATLVWQGSYSSGPGRTWAEIELNQTFLLPPGKNLMIYWIHEHGSGYPGSAYVHNHTATPNQTAIYAQSDASLPITSSGTLTVNRPNARFFFVGMPTDSNSVAMHSIDYPVDVVQSGVPAPIVVTIKNRGIKDLKSCLIYYSVNGVIQNGSNPYQWTGNLYDDFNAQTTIGTYNPSVGGADEIKVWVKMPNGVVDTITYDDTLSVTILGCAKKYGAGTYIVGSSDTADFSSLNDAVRMLIVCGDTGNITLKVEDGIYNETVNFSDGDFESILGRNRKLTITSISEDPTKVTIAGASAGDCMLFSNTSNVLIEYLTLDGTIRGAYKGVRFTQENRNIEIRNCDIKVNPIATSSSYIGIHYDNTSGSNKRGQNIKIANNTIDGGYYNIYLYYTGSGSGADMGSMTIDSNILTNSYYYGIYAYYYGYYPSISYNTITSRPTGITQYSSTWYGIRLYYYVSFEQMVGNKIYSSHTSITTPYGIDLYNYINYNNYGTTNRNPLIANNEIILYGTGAGNGINIGTTLSPHIFNNSVYMYGTGAARGIYLGNTSASYIPVIKNNNFIVDAGTSATPIYYSNVSYITYYTVDYNNYLDIKNGVVGSVGGTMYYSIQSLQEQTLQDANSVVKEVSFATDPTQDLKLESYVGLSCPRNANVTVDIDGDARGASTSMGAYINNAFNLKLNDVVEPPKFLCSGDSSWMKIEISNDSEAIVDCNQDTIKITVYVKDGTTNEIIDSVKAEKNNGILGPMLSDVVTVVDRDNKYFTEKGVYCFEAMLSTSRPEVKTDDNLKELCLDVFPSYDGYTFYDTTCTSELPYMIGDSSFMASGTYTVTLKTVNGCDSVGILHLQVNQSYQDTATLSICENELPYTYGPHVFPIGTETGDYTIEFTTVDKCDSIIDLHLIVNPIYDGGDELSICAIELPYTYGDTVFEVGTVSDIYIVPFTTVNGCDSIIRLNLNVYDECQTSVRDSICKNEIPDGYTFGDSVFTQSGVYLVTFHTSSGDSIVLLTLTVHRDYSGLADVKTICSAELPYVYGDTVFDVGTVSDIYYNVRLSTIHGCDSLVTLSLTVNPSPITPVTVSICDTELPYTHGDSTFYSEGNYEVYYSLPTNCDSVVKLELIVYPTYAAPDQVHVCDSLLPYTYGDSVLTKEGFYNIMFKSIYGCDSMANLTFDVSYRPSKPSAIQGQDTALNGTYTYQINPSDRADSYQWGVSNSNWTIVGDATGTSVNVTIPYDTRRGTLYVYALNDCGLSARTSLMLEPATSIVETEEDKVFLGQNIPNPASTMTRIPYSIPEDGKVVFRVMSVSGQVLHTQEVNSPAGKQSIEIDIQQYSNGIYYYTMEYDGRNIVKKMNIQR